jgi:sulfite exporter TauE/SafE
MNTIMQPYLIAFITGITTGGLSCLAVQGGLLASSLGRQLEQDMIARPKKGRPQHRPALPIALFLIAKIIAYTLLGFLLGTFGAVLTLTPALRAILLIAIGIFMIGNALRMLNVHPIFRYFAIEPPRFITRYIRSKSKNGTDLATPLFLGALTVFIPCGVTQAMMAVAIASGSAIQGAGLMLAFTLGTSPVFFLVAYLTTSLGARLEKVFMRFVAVVILVLGMISIASGLNLVGVRTPVAGLFQRLIPGQEQFLAQSGETAADPASSSQAAGSMLTLAAKNNGYFPEVLYAQANSPVTLNIVTQNTVSCAIAFYIPALLYETMLPRSGTTTVEIPPQEPGSVMPFTCSMGMYTGQIVFQ